MTRQYLSEIIDLQSQNIGYSLRRYFVDEFHFRHVPTLPTGSYVLDLGGNKIRKRGQFDIEQYDLRVIYSNLSTAKQPDVQADASCIPFKDGSFDAVICSELLEHVPDPLAVLREMHRVLQPGGTFLICVPFLFHIHGDPDDYGRYTDHYWRENLARFGFMNIEIERQGLFWSVLVDMLRGLAYQMVQEGRPRSAWVRRQMARLIGIGKRMALRWEAQPGRYAHPFLSKFTTGFGIQADKPSRPKVFFTGGDNMNWALDDDLRLTKRALAGVVELSTLEECDVVHSMWWAGLVGIPEKALSGKRIICHMPGEPFRYLKLPAYSKIASMVEQWIVRTREAEQELASMGIKSKLIPYTTDTEIFYPIPADDPELVAFRQRWAIPPDRYLIGNFHRDTEGHDLKSPKLMKGPDIFVEIMRGLKEKGYNIHIILAGPRRFWMRRRLDELNIPYTFVGEPVEGTDDIGVNILPRPTLNLLYNLIDLYVISSRTEGGPQSIMEAAASKCKVISTRVGLAPDILEAACIYPSPVEAVQIIEQDIQNNRLQDTLGPHYQRLIQKHQPSAVAPLFRDLYAHIEQIPPFAGRPHHHGTAPEKQALPPHHVPFRKQSADLTVGLWHKFFKPPYGGGNQFMLALRKALNQRGIRLVENELHSDVDVYLLNSIHFDVDRFLDFSQQHELHVVQRIDGPIHLIRGFDREKDELCFRLNAQFASATILQSAWTYQRIVEMGYQPVNAVIIHNAVDPDIFHPRGHIPFDLERKIRLISTSWSGNPRKGGPIYKWIEEHLDWGRFEYTLVGNFSERFERIRHIPPVSSEELADILRQHDIYITASRNDPCSNALIEALACGLPALYLNDGGHPELVGYGGLSFNNVDEILPQLEVLVENYEMFQGLIVLPSLDEVAEKYLTLLREAAQ